MPVSIERQTEVTRASMSAAGAILVVTMVHAYSIGAGALAVFMEAMSRDLHWTRAQLGGGVTAIQIGMAAVATIGGRIISRVGARRVLLPIILLEAVILLALPFAEHGLLIFYGLFFLIGVASAGTMGAGRILSGWFYRHRALALGILGVGTTLSGVLTPPIAQWLLQHTGWRTGFAIFGVAILLLPLPAFLLFGHEKPGARGGPAVAADCDHDGAPHISALGAARTRVFWIMIGAQLGSIFSFMAIITHGIGILSERGLPRDAAVQGLSLIALGGTLANVLTGALLDRIGKPAVILPFAALSLIGMIIVQCGSGGTTLLTGAFLFGLGVGGENSMTSYFVTRFFGVRNYSEVYGLIMPLMLVIAAPAPVIIGRLYDANHSYWAALPLIDAALVLGAVCFALLPRYPYPTADALARAKSVPLGG
jgi:MFS family permease